jgi:hypothetical protein
MDTYKSIRYSCVVLSILSYFFCFAGRGLQADFSHDDLMNLYKSWYPPVGQHLVDIVAFFKFSDSYRPLGSLFYRLLFDAYGMQALPYRVACYILLLLNIWLAYCVVRRLTHSREVAVVTVLLFSYHREFWTWYLSTGFCYDLLCFCFYMAAFLYYLKHRHASWIQVLIWSILYILCLDSKELGVTLPAAICVYELLRRKPSKWKTWLTTDAKIAIAGAIITLLFVFGRVYGNGGLSAVDGYVPVYRPEVYLARAYHLLSDAFYGAHWMTPIAAALLFLFLAAMAVWSRWFPLRFAVAWMPVAILPVAFIPERGLASASMAALGLAIAIALIVTEIGRWLFYSFKHRQTAQFVLVLLLLIAVNEKYGRIDYEGHSQEGALIRSIYDQIRAMQPVMPHDSNVLFLHDPFPEMPWATSFIVALHSKDLSVRVYRLDRLPKDAPKDFNIVFSYERNRLVSSSPVGFMAFFEPSPYRQPASIAGSQLRLGIKSK